MIAADRPTPRRFLAGLIAGVLVAVTAVGVAYSQAAEPYGREEGMYRSNDRFLPIEEISEAERGEYTWVMEVSPGERRIVRELYRRGELYRRQVEEIGADGLPREIGTVDAEGELVERWRYRYDAKRRLRSVEVLGAGDSPDGVPREEGRFVTGAALADGAGLDGSAAADRAGPDGSRAAEAGDAGPGGPAETEGAGSDSAARQTEDVLQERDGEALLRTVYRYDASGRLLRLSRYRDGELLEERFREYAAGVVVREVTRFPEERRRVITEYNEQGLPAAEEVYEAERLTRRVEKEYDEDGRLVREIIDDRERRELRYSYGEDGELAEEEEILNGALRRRITYGTGEERLETRFRGGEPFLRVYFDGDSRLREEVILDGEVVEVREFEGE